MATRKIKKYAEGKMVYEDDVDTSDEMYSDFGSKSGTGAAGTSETATASEKPAMKPKASVVTKEELAKSGLSLRDYMNKQQGLTRKGGSSAPDTGDESSRLASRYAKPALRQETMRERAESYNRKRGIPGYKEGGSVSSASKRADGIAMRGKTRGKIC
jgi:hypothetical protein